METISPSVLTHTFNYNGFTTNHISTMYGNTPYGDYLRMKDEFLTIEKAWFKKHCERPSKKQPKMVIVEGKKVKTESVTVDLDKFSLPPLSRNPKKHAKEMAKYEQLLFNTKHVHGELDRCGSLRCVFCGKKNLVIYHWSDKNKNVDIMATTDHFNPKSNGGSPLNLKNCVVSCYRCNRKKLSYKWSIRTLRYLSHYGDFKTLAKQLNY